MKDNNIAFLKKEIEKIIRESLESQQDVNLCWINEILEVADKTKTGLKIDNKLISLIQK